MSGLDPASRGRGARIAAHIVMSPTAKTTMGLVSSAVQPYLWRAASHFRIMKLAFQGKLDNDPQRYAHCVYPQQLDEIIELEIKRIHGRIDLIQSNPMLLHPPAAELAIPDHLKLSGWPGSSGKP